MDYKKMWFGLKLSIMNDLKTASDSRRAMLLDMLIEMEDAEQLAFGEELKAKTEAKQKLDTTCIDAITRWREEKERGNK
jgi:hypothetical protein